MPKINIHIKIVRHIILIWFVLFSLSPCIVKEVIFSSINADYVRPLNKSKIITSANTCLYSQNVKQEISIVKKSKLSKEVEYLDFLDNTWFELHSTSVYNKYSKTSSGNSPPIYILYKRLKIGIA